MFGKISYIKMVRFGQLEPPWYIKTVFKSTCNFIQNVCSSQIKWGAEFSQRDRGMYNEFYQKSRGWKLGKAAAQKLEEDSIRCRKIVDKIAQNKCTDKSLRIMTTPIVYSLTNMRQIPMYIDVSK